MALMLLAAVTLSRAAADWGNVRVAEDGGRWTASLANSRIVVEYGDAGIADKPLYDRIVKFAINDSGAVVANKLDGRHTLGDTAFFTITNASVAYDGPDKKTVDLAFGNGARVTRVSIFPDSPVLQLDYQFNVGQTHNLDYGIMGDTWEIYGAAPWKARNGWTKTYPTLQDDITEDGSYYRKDWSGTPGPLDYNGSMIMGVYSSRHNRGVGLVLPSAAVSWLKLIDTGASGSGFERWTTGNHTAYLYAVTGGGAEIISMGKHIVDNGPAAPYPTPSS